jgi:hypothetical protein
MRMGSMNSPCMNIKPLDIKKMKIGIWHTQNSESRE